jgi:hypothetical protein
MFSSMLLRACSFAALLTLAAAPAAEAQYTVEVYASLAPNAFGSPSWPGYTQNAMMALQTNQEAVGEPSKPTYYERTSTLASGRMLIVTDFHSWHGIANPGGDFALEHGNRLHFGVHVHSDGAPFSLSQLNFAIDSKIGHGLNLDFKGSFDESNSYGVSSSGAIIIGQTATDEIINSGPSTQLVTDLWYTGVGNAFEVLRGYPGATEQEKIETFLADNPALLEPFTVTGTYWLTKKPGGKGGAISPKGSAVVIVNPTRSFSSPPTSHSRREAVKRPHR